jgi:hypothetical protein
VDSFRFRHKGKRWSDWSKHRIVLEPGWNGVGAGLGFESL